MEVEQDDDKTLWGNRLKAWIDKWVPKRVVDILTDGGNCSCSLRQDLMNNWCYAWRDYKENVKLNKEENGKGN